MHGPAMFHQFTEPAIDLLIAAELAQPRTQEVPDALF
jgi:hypothetical protein